MNNIGIPFLKKFAKNVANFRPVPARAKQALIKTMQQGKPLPAVIKKALATRAVIRKAVQAPSMVRKAVPTAMVRRAVPTAMVRKAVPTAMVRRAVPTAMVRKTVPTAMVRRAVPTAMVRKAVPQKGGLFANIKKLIQTTNPSVVKSVSPVQRSFMPVDLPYETMSKKQTALRIPATNFAMPTNIDLIQPPVDGGTSNYYGK
jgi:hypothetical protein